MEVCVVRGTPPSTPLRRNVNRTRSSPRVSATRRRSLFREESDLSDISPLSPSSEDKTPKKKSPRKEDSTPLKGVKGISSLTLDSPVVKVHSEGSRMRGVTSINNEDVGSIPPNMFYGSHTEPRPPHTWIRKENSKAKTKLFLDDLPRDRKRARTSSGQKIQPSAKRHKKSHPGNSPRTPLTPVPMLGQKRSLGKGRKKVSLLKNQQSTKSPGPNSSSEPVNDENVDLNQSKDFVTTEKDVKDMIEQELSRRAKKRNSQKANDNLDMVGNWEISFTKESRLNECSTPSSNPNRRFFKSQANTTPKMIRKASSALTPPWSSHKNTNLKSRRSLCKPNYVFSPIKNSQGNVTSDGGVPLRRSPRKSSILQQQKLDVSTISQDITEMMEDEPIVETNDSVTELIQQLNQNDCTNDWATALPSPEEDEMVKEEPKTPVKTGSPFKCSTKDENDSNLFPIFRSSGKSGTKMSPSISQTRTEKKKSLRFFGLGEDQYQIDSGQNNLREVQCKQCGLLYSMGCPEDEIIHSKYHSNRSILTYNGWKKEKVVSTFENDKVICILKDHPKSWWNKAKDVVEMIDSILGFPPLSIDALRDPKIYFYVRDKEIAGCLVSEQISSGFKLLSLEQDVDLCSEESYPAKCGISRIWVNSKYRRSSIATRLLNVLRAYFAYGVILGKEDLAFTVPTDDGKKFISEYMGQKTGYLVYM